MNIKIKSFFITNSNIITSVLAVFAIRFILSFLPSFQIDMGTWLAWAHRLATTGFSNFYSDTTWTQYTPGYLYYLWVIGKLGLVNDLAIKIPVVLADLVTGVLIWSLVKKVNNKLALVCFFLYTLNPVVIFDGSVWGQIDGLLTVFLFLSVYFLLEKKSFVWSTFFWALAFLIKPQSIAILPGLLMAILLKRFRLKEIILGIFTGLVAIVSLSLPFFTQNPFLGLLQWIIKMGNYYSYTSVNAFNIWTWVGMWIPDSTKFVGLSYSVWGTIVLLVSIIFALFVFRKKLDNKVYYYLLFAILSLCFFTFPTKVHERYLFPFFAFLITAAGLSNSLNLFSIYAITSIASFANIYYPYSYYGDNFLKSDFFQNLTASFAKIIGFIFLMSYFALLFWEKLPKFSWKLKPAKSSVPEKFPKISLSKKTSQIVLGVILVFAFFTRVFALNSPTTMYFDEVYHAFTAKVIMGPDVAKAWEWWNTPPPGFAYEWTHPPLAKLGMVLGMLVFGQNSFGWRIPGAILGVGSVFLVYLLAKTIFEDEALALLSAGAFSLDGLALVMSRIGMNDSYILFFSLLSIYLYLKDKNFLSSLSLGLALASKWSAIWAVPIFLMIFLSQRKKLNWSYLWFFTIPLIVYLASYFDMFLTGHNLTIWWGMQEQMWWYHTGLKATHPYSSMWWSWPLLIRPIYLYTSDEIGGMVSRIYAMGNPLVFWFGFISIIASFVYAFIEKNKKLGLVVFSYFIFFVPWALSPRIMFLYHYLPSIPFMCIAIGYVLRKSPRLTIPFFVFAFTLFVYFFPHWAGLSIPLWLDKSYYWINSWR